MFRVSFFSNVHASLEFVSNDIKTLEKTTVLPSGADTKAAVHTIPAEFENNTSRCYIHTMPTRKFGKNGKLLVFSPTQIRIQVSEQHTTPLPQNRMQRGVVQSWVRAKPWLKPSPQFSFLCFNTSVHFKTFRDRNLNQTRFVKKYLQDYN